jgi:tetratricopeptide (TPR) repeat protein
MNFKIFVRYAFFLTAIMVAGCNLFNPSGDGDAGDTNLNRQGEEFHRRGQYAKAMEAYERAIAKDSANSMAYYGYAKAAVAMFKLDKILILDDVEAMAKNPTQFAFLAHEDSILTLRMQAASRVRLMLGLLTDRDTLTQWYRYLTDSSANDPANSKYDSAYTTRRNFIEQYLVNASLNIPGHRKESQFPLTDFRMPYKNVLIDYTAFDLLYTITRLYDLDLNDTIDHRDAMMKLLNFGSDSGFSISNLSSIADSLEGDTVKTQNLNNLIANMSSGLVGTSQLAGLFSTGGSDTGSTESQTSGNMDSVITSMGDAILFYQFGDKIDNDGDGCVDEELMDELDNDFDGFADEDARVIPFNKPDGVDNNHDGFLDPINPTFPLLPGTDSLGYEEPIGEATYPGRGFVLGFVYAHLDSTNEKNLPPLQTSWVKIKKGAPPENMEFRLAVQRDSLLTKRLPNGKLPASLGARLAEAKDQIGGCWRNIEAEAP